MPLIAQTTATLNSVVQCVRLKLHDLTIQDRLTGAFTSGGTTLAVSDGTRFAEGDIVDFPEDGTQSVYYVRSVSGNNLTVQIHLGSTDANHSSGATVRKRPKHTRQEIEDGITHAVDALWPTVWDNTTTTVTPSTSAYHFAAPSDFMDLIYATQKGTESTNISYSTFNTGSLRVQVKRGLPTGDFASGAAFVFPDGFYNQTNTVLVTYARKVTSSTISSGLMADTVCWGAVAVLLGGDAIDLSKPFKPADAASPRTLDAIRAAVNARSEYEKGKVLLKAELDKTFPRVKLYRG